MKDRSYSESQTALRYVDQLSDAIKTIKEQQRKINLLRAAITYLLGSADASWEEKNMGHDWTFACELARDTLKEAKT